MNRPVSGSSTEPVTETALRYVTRLHVEKTLWPSIRNDPKAGPDGYLHYCSGCQRSWPCPESIVATALTSADARADAAEREVERLREVLTATASWNWPEDGGLCWCSMWQDGTKPHEEWCLRARSILQASAVEPRDSDE